MYREPPRDVDRAAAVQPRRVRSAERVAAVLDLLCSSPEPLRHADVAKAIGLPKSSASNLLDTLAHVGLIAHDERGYSLGVKLIGLGTTAAARLDLRAIARPVMQELSELGIGTVNLAILQGHEVRYIEKLADPDQLIQIHTSVGAALPAHTTALGKVLVAALPADDRTAWVSAHRFTAMTEHTITSPEVFQRALRFCIDHGYARDEEESHLRVVCIAAPVVDHAGETVAAISLSCLRADFQEGRAEPVEAVVDGARRISALLGRPRSVAILPGRG